MQNDLFSPIAPEIEELRPGIFLFRSHVNVEEFMKVVTSTAEKIPFRQMITPGGKKINVSVTSMGENGWYSDRRGYRYERIDPVTGNEWPKMPKDIETIISNAAKKAGFENFFPDSCLINCYKPGVGLTAHVDKDEIDFSQPIVSVSLGVSAVFQIFGENRNGKVMNIPLHSGDLLIFGGPARKFYHGVRKIKVQSHPLTGNLRFNLTFRRAL